MNKAYIIGIIIILAVVIRAALLWYPAKHPQCQDPNVIGVFSCPDGSLRVISRLEGAGYKIIKPDGSEVSCPVIAEPSEECKKALDVCSDVNLC